MTENDAPGIEHAKPFRTWDAAFARTGYSHTNPRLGGAASFADSQSGYFRRRRAEDKGLVNRRCLGDCGGDSLMERRRSVAPRHRA
jgi:hypothetical protein